MLNLEVHKVTTRLSRVNTLKPGGYFMYHQILTLKNSAFYPPHSICLFCKRYRNKQQLFPKTAPPDWFLQPSRSAFIVRYELHL